LEREQLAQRTTGKTAGMLGRVLPGESQLDLYSIAIEYQLLAQDGYVPLRQGDKVWYKHIDELTCQDRPAKIEYEKELVSWLKGRLEDGRRLSQGNQGRVHDRRRVARQVEGKCRNQLC
jgi:hypothetical protein